MTLKLRVPPMPEPEGMHMVLGAREPFWEPTYQFTEEQLTARDTQWLELVRPLVQTLRELDEAYCRAGSQLTRQERAEDRQRLIKARAAMRAITEEQE